MSHAHTAEPTRPPLRLRHLIRIALLALLVLFILPGRPAWVATFVTYILAVLLEAVPFIIIGALISGAVAIFLPSDILPRVTRRLGGASLPATMGLAFVFPVCECGVVAVARGLLRKGLPLGCTIVYLLAAPILNPVVLASTAVAFQFDWRFVIARLIGAVFVSVPLAVLLGRMPADTVFTPKFRESLNRGDDEHAHTHPVARRVKFKQLFAHARQDLLDMVPYLMMGVALAAIMQTFLGSRLLSAFAANRVAGTSAMMGTAFALSLCSEADAFVGKTFYQTFGFTAVMAFLVLGPMLDIKLLLMYRTVFKRRFILYLALSVTAGVAVYAALLGILL
jgi:uncharacterized membrane protein YraQ (UPF0718 family)